MTLAQKFSSALNEIDDKFIVEAIEYQHHKVKLSRGKSLLLIAVLIVGLTATVMAAHLWELAIFSYFRNNVKAVNMRRERSCQNHV